MIRVVAYARVSTLLGQDVLHQLHGIRELAKQRQFDLVEEYCDQGVSGKAEKRPALDKLIKDARRGHFSIIIIHGIDRLGRSTKHLLNLIDELRHYNVSLISIRESLDFTTPTGQACLIMLSAVAQLEAQLISERIKTALAVKKAVASKTNNGWTCGRPTLDSDLIEKVIKLRNSGLSVRKISAELKTISKSSVSKIIQESSRKREQNSDQ
jgi:DNA invertase Pin-like site-specific DNA recombinase